MSDTCGFKWRAPYLYPPPSKQVGSVQQVCCLPKGHEGVHRSLSNVIKEQK